MANKGALANFLSPTEADYALIGRIALQHTSLEYQIEALVWFYMGNVDKGHVATRQLGSVQITNMLETLVDWTEPDDGAAEAVEWAIKCFHTNRLNRNSVVHAFNFGALDASGALKLERRTKNLVFGSFEQFELTREDLERLSRDQIRLALFIHDLERSLKERGRQALGPNLPPPASPLPLRARPPEPEVLEPSGQEIPRSARSQRRSWSEKVAKLEKVRHKDRQRADAKARKKD